MAGHQDCKIKGDVGERKMRVASVFYSALFFVLAIFQFRNSPPDSFVLLTISLIFAISLVKKEGEVYALSASILAIVFASLSALSALSSSLVLLISHKPFALAFESQLGVLGFLTLPVVLRYRKLQSYRKSYRTNRNL